MELFWIFTSNSSAGIAAPALDGSSCFDELRDFLPVLAMFFEGFHGRLVLLLCPTASALGVGAPLRHQ